MPTGLSTQRFAATRSSLAPHVTDRHRPHSFAWDYEERMTSATVNSVTTTFAYWGDGLRDSRTTGMATTTFTWDIAAGLPVVIDDGARYVYGAGLEAQVSGGNTYYYLADGLGSTMKTVDASGTVVNSYTYDVYGKKTSSSGSQSNEFDFAGQQTDPTGLQYLRARYMDPETGTFLTRDPLEPSGQHPHGYAGTNPVMASDPQGTEVCSQTECVVPQAGCSAYTYKMGVCWRGAWSGSITSVVDKLNDGIKHASNSRFVGRQGDVNFCSDIGKRDASRTIAIGGGEYARSCDKYGSPAALNPRLTCGVEWKSTPPTIYGQPGVWYGAGTCYNQFGGSIANYVVPDLDRGAGEACLYGAAGAVAEAVFFKYKNGIPWKSFKISPWSLGVNCVIGVTIHVFSQ